MKIVLIEWVDSNLFHGWVDKDGESFGVAECKSVGFLLKKHRSEITLALSRSKQDQVSQCITIPRGCVKSIEVLKDET